MKILPPAGAQRSRQLTLLVLLLVVLHLLAEGPPTWEAAGLALKRLALTVHAAVPPAVYGICLGVACLSVGKPLDTFYR